MDWYLTDGKSRITREIHAVKKTQEFCDNESENISGESKLLCRCGPISVFPGYSRAALINLFVPDAVLIWGRRLIEGGAYSSKYGNHAEPCTVGPSNFKITHLITPFIVHSTKLLNFDWSRAVQLIPNCTPWDYLLSFHGNDVILLNVL